MPFAFLLMVGLFVFSSGVIEDTKDSKQEKTAEVIASKVEAKPVVKEIKQIPKKLEPVKEEIKAE